MNNEEKILEILENHHIAINAILDKLGLKGKLKRNEINSETSHNSSSTKDCLQNVQDTKKLIKEAKGVIKKSLKRSPS